VQTHVSYTVLSAAACRLVVWLGYLWWRTDRLADRHPLRLCADLVGVLVIAAAHP
jgi:hypothetical protein